MNKTIGFALCGSFCTFRTAIDLIKALINSGYTVVPIMSTAAATIDTRFGKAEDFISEIEETCGRKVIKTISDAEPLGPSKILDALIVAPCTGNTLAKLANGISDTPVTMAVKTQLRNKVPVIIAVSTNDGLGLNGKNINTLFNTKGIYFVPFRQDDHMAKPNSLVAKYEMIPETLDAALFGNQIQPVIV